MSSRMPMPHFMDAMAARVQQLAADPRAKANRDLLLAHDYTRLCPAGPCAGTAANGFWCLAADANTCVRMKENRVERQRIALDRMGVPDGYRGGDQSRVIESWKPRLAEYMESLGAKVNDGLGLVFGGAPGTGKSQCLGLIAEMAATVGIDCCYCAGGDTLVDAIMGSIVRGKETKHDDYKLCDLLLVDDLDRALAVAKADGSSAALARLDTFFDFRYATRRATCVATNATGDQILKVAELQRTVDRWRERMVWLGTQDTSQRGLRDHDN